MNQRDPEQVRAREHEHFLERNLCIITPQKTAEAHSSKPIDNLHYSGKQFKDLEGITGHMSIHESEERLARDGVNDDASTGYRPGQEKAYKYLRSSSITV
ncbi:hypothetical protein MMC16_000049 [Acarospora aff. strigata]|nr:hypothetical protein [Acarospora aff. strigata]